VDANPRVLFCRSNSQCVPYVSEKLHCYVGTGLGVCQGVVVIGEVKAASGGNCVELMVGESILEMAAGCGQGVIENVVRIVHLIDPVDCLEATSVKRRIVGNKGITFQQRDNFFPNLGKDRSIFRVFRAQTMNFTAKPVIVLRLRMDETVEGVNYYIITHEDQANAADTGWLLVGCLKVQTVE